MSNQSSNAEQYKKTAEKTIDIAYRVCYTFLKNRKDIFTVVATTVVQRVSYKYRFQSKKAETAWIAAAAEKNCREFLREERNAIDNGILDRPEYNDAGIPQNEILHYLLTLPREIKSVVYLYYYEGFTTLEIAEMLNLRPAAVRNRLNDARKNRNITRQNVHEAYELIRISDDDKSSLLNQVDSDCVQTTHSGISIRSVIIFVFVLALLLGASAILAFYKPWGKKSLPVEQTVPFATTPQPIAKDMPAEYRSIVNSIRQAKTDNWNSEQFFSNDFSYMYAEITDLSQIGYNLVDLDGNNTDELLITDGNVIYDMYTLQESELVHIFTGSEKSTYRLCEKNYIFNMVTDGTQYKEYNLFYLHNSDFIQEQIVIFDGRTNELKPWFVGFGREMVNSDKAAAIIASYNPITIKMLPLA